MIESSSSLLLFWHCLSQNRSAILRLSIRLSVSLLVGLAAFLFVSPFLCLRVCLPVRLSREKPSAAVPFPSAWRRHGVRAGLRVVLAFVFQKFIPEIDEMTLEA